MQNYTIAQGRQKRYGWCGIAISLFFMDRQCTEAERCNSPQSDIVADVVADIIADVVVADTIADIIADIVADTVADTIPSSTPDIFPRYH